MATEKAKKLKKQKIDDRPNLNPDGKPGPKSKRKPVGSKKRKKGSHWRSSEVNPENVGKNPKKSQKKMESDDSEVEIPDDLEDDPVPKTKTLKVRLILWNFRVRVMGQNLQKWNKTVAFTNKKFHFMAKNDEFKKTYYFY